MASWNFNLSDQLTFYGSYHNNRWNQLIHFFFVPLLLWSGAVWFCYSGPIVTLPASVPNPWHTLLTLNLAFFTMLAYVAYYISMDLFAGATWAVCLGFPLLWGACAFQAWVPMAWAWAFLAQFIGWYAQIHPGHMVFEKRRPALMDSFFQSLVLAPLFVWFELLFLLGYRKNLNREVKSRVENNIASWKASQAGPDKEPLIATQSGKE